MRQAPVGRRTGEDVRERAKPQVTLPGNSKATSGQKGTDLVDSPGDRGAVHSVEQGQSPVRELEPQDDQRGDDPVGKHQLVIRSRTGRTQPAAASTLVQSALLCGRPRLGQLRDQRTESTALEAGEETMGQGRTAKVLRHNNTQPARPCSCHGRSMIVIARHVAILWHRVNPSSG